jgi:hypothetical protein
MTTFVVQYTTPILLKLILSFQNQLLYEKPFFYSNGWYAVVKRCECAEYYYP